MSTNNIFKIDKDTLSNTTAALSNNAALDNSSAQILEVLDKRFNAMIRCTCVLVALDSIELAYQVLQQIRTHSDPRIYLIQVTLLSGRSLSDMTGQDALLAQSFDSVIEPNSTLEYEIQRLEPTWVATQHWISSVPNINDALQDTSLRFKLLRYLSSRKVTLSPVKTIQNKLGYVFPALRAFAANDDLSVNNVLAFLEQQQLLMASFLERAHACGSCNSVFLNFKETCPDCRSTNIDKDQLVHHFTCGTIESFANFQQGANLVCPKCDKSLKHVGVDYDKPSTVNKCNSCSLSFQEPHVEAQCYSCGRTSDIQDLLVLDIEAYDVTSIGDNAALYGLDALFTQILQTDLQLYTNQEVKHYIKIEQARIKRYQKSVTTLGCVYLKNLDEVYSRLGKKTEQLFKELSAVFKAVVRESDLITARNESLFAIVMTETDVESSKNAMQRLETAIIDVFEDSLDFSLDMQFGFYDINDVADLDIVFNHFISPDQ